MASGFYNSFFHYEGEGDFDFSADTIKVALVTSSYTYDRDLHDYFDDITNEVVGTGYTAGGQALTSVTWTKDDANDKSVLDANDVAWAASTITARGAVIYKDTGTPGTSPLIAFIDFAADKSTNNTEFKITWNSNGILDKAEA